MKVKKLTENSCDLLFEKLKTNYDGVKDYYHRHGRTFSAVTRSYDKTEGSYEIDSSFVHYSCQIDLETDGKGTFDFENAKKIYNAFEGLTPLEANDERFWTRLTHDQCHKYAVKRWMGGKEKSQKVIKERFFFRGNAQSARVRNAVSRLWWIAYLTVKPEEEDEEKKWEYTKAICESQDFITSILERTMGTYPQVRFGVLEYFIENREDFGSNKSKKIQKLLKDLNNYGGVSMLSLMDKDEVKALISELI